MNVCNTCWGMGNKTEDAAKYREEVALRWVQVAKSKIHKASAPTIKAVMRDWMTEEERETLRKHPDFAWMATRSDRWAKVHRSWTQAQAFAKSMISGFGGKTVELTVKGRRAVSCFGKELDGTVVGSPCPALTHAASGVYCGECGCSEKEITRLDGHKLDFPYLECPRGRPGFANEGDVVPNVEDF